MKYPILFIILVLISHQFFGQIISERDFSIGKTIVYKSTIMGEHRNINIYLPSNYSVDSSTSYPVIYLLDGSKDEDFIHISGIVQFGSFSWIKMIPESIVVGIGNVDRKRDFTYPSENELDQKEFPSSGQSATFIRFLENELQPFIDATYRTTSITTIIGQSLGGLLATEILYKHPELFDNYIIVSPSLWWDDESLLDEQPTSYVSNKSIYIAVGKEGEAMERAAKALFDQLKKAQKQNTRLFFEFLADKTHGDVLHIAVYNAFGKIFNKYNN